MPPCYSNIFYKLRLDTSRLYVLGFAIYFREKLIGATIRKGISFYFMIIIHAMMNNIYNIYHFVLDDAYRCAEWWAFAHNYFHENKISALLDEVIYYEYYFIEMAAKACKIYLLLLK